MDPSCIQATPFCREKTALLSCFRSVITFPSLLDTECFHYLFAGFQSCIVGKAITRSSNVSPKYSTDVHSERGIKATRVSGNVRNNLDHQLCYSLLNVHLGAQHQKQGMQNAQTRCTDSVWKPATGRRSCIYDQMIFMIKLCWSSAQPSGWYSAELLCFLFGQCPFLADGSLHNDEKCEWAAVISAHHLCILQYQQ